MPTCTGPGKRIGTRCGRAAVALGLCYSHYRQQLRRGEGELTPIGIRAAAREVLEGTNLKVDPAARRAVLEAARALEQTPYEVVRGLVESTDFAKLAEQALAESDG